MPKKITGPQRLAQYLGKYNTQKKIIKKNTQENPIKQNTQVKPIKHFTITFTQAEIDAVDAARKFRQEVFDFEQSQLFTFVDMVQLQH